jgi:hypothetical protein
MSLAGGLPLFIQRSPTFGASLAVEQALGAALLLSGLLATHVLIVLAAKDLGRRTSYYAVIPLLYSPVGAWLALFNLWDHTDKPSTAPTDQRNVFIGALQGKEPLAIVWWGLAFPLGLALSALNRAAPSHGMSSTAMNSAIAITSLAVYVLNTVMIWRCAPNVQDTLWKWVARCLVIAALFANLYAWLR